MSVASDIDFDPTLDKDILDSPRADNETVDSPDESESAKEEGNRKFREGLFQEAVDLWNRSVRSIEFLLGKNVFEGEKLNEILEMRRTLWSNISQGYLKMNKFHEAVTYCDNVLREQTTNVKALFRKAEALFSLGEYEKAKATLMDLLGFQPGNSAAEQLLAKVDVQLKKYKQKTKKMMSNVLSRLETDERTLAALQREEENMEVHELVTHRVSSLLAERTPALETQGQRTLTGFTWLDAAVNLAYEKDCLSGKWIAKTFHKGLLMADDLRKGILCQRRSALAAKKQ